MKLPKFIRAILGLQPDLPVRYEQFIDYDTDAFAHLHAKVKEMDGPAYVRNFRKTPEQRSDQAKLGHIRKRAREAAKRENASG